ncbi:MAG: HyaD/HybD family hydrogenase maturation endopeptidase [Desulfobacula sp.]|nr:HyaD/HybD family hydrogenase maturation endopeptidase [Desulfobacula sp.]
MSKEKIAVIGIGNILMQDEGIGVHIIKELEKYSFNPHIALIDGGNMGMDLLPFFDEHDKMIIVDAVDFEKQPGFIDTIENDDILTLFTTKMSLHHLGLKDVLSYAKLLDQTPKDLSLIGIQPKKVELDMKLSKTINSKIDTLTHMVLEKLKTWGINSETT